MKKNKYNISRFTKNPTGTLHYKPVMVVKIIKRYKKGKVKLWARRALSLDEALGVLSFCAYYLFKESLKTAYS